MEQGHSTDVVDDRKGKYIPIRDADEPELGMFDKPLPCCGCGIGWFFLLLGFVFPLMWYVASVLYFMKYYHKDPRERSGLTACAIAATFFTIAAVIALLVILL
ncbi:60S ribosomal protein L18a-like protein [Mercurialis annua]|uniref:60S ribosomal protein L18a-like protein n=1 Tax=Mercurialis annua TaxID=3986 RepID=UPI00215FB058|nr:60S ribosomal protein L18a-like protein [Mercurialis annua]XP_050230707.1 60S ribosomal protein L18a-like protein [Mercurialis annua]